MRVGWLADQAPGGGAELTQLEFRAAAPDDVEIVTCLPGLVDQDCNRYVIHNCVNYSASDLAIIAERPAVKYWHDVGPWVKPDVRELLDAHAQAICCSPAQATHMRLPAAKLIPPAVDLGRFTDAAQAVCGERTGAVSVGSWANHGKAPWRVSEWGKTNGDVDFYGTGELAPTGCAAVRYEDMPELLARYRTFVFLPTTLEPFGRTVVEAWAAGCELVTNRLVGALHWIESDPDAIERAPVDFWSTVLETERVAA